MSELTARDRELVALGAALGSNCIPCVEYHIPEARKAGLTDPEIHAAIELADKVRQVPARKVLETALKLLPSAAGAAQDAGASDGCGRGDPGAAGDKEAAGAGSDATPQPSDVVMSMMSKFMSACGAQARSAGAPSDAEKKPGAPAPSQGCGCG